MNPVLHERSMWSDVNRLPIANKGRVVSKSRSAFRANHYSSAAGKYESMMETKIALRGSSKF